MKIVADTNTFLAVAMGEPERAAVLKATRDVDLVSPEVLPFEIGNALTAMLKRRALDPEDIPKVWGTVQRIPVELREIDIPRALKIASVQRIYAYDGYFLECAERLRLPLLTLDGGLKSAAEQLSIRLVEID